jgi:hypothetical protein
MVKYQQTCIYFKKMRMCLWSNCAVKISIINSSVRTVIFGDRKQNELHVTMKNSLGKCFKLCYTRDGLRNV